MTGKKGMMCSLCKREFMGWQIQESHDVPCYLFEDKLRNHRKNRADKLGRHHLCKECHLKYERDLRLQLRIISKQFASKYFEDKDGN